jgi:hypothetical protein
MIWSLGLKYFFSCTSSVCGCVLLHYDRRHLVKCPPPVPHNTQHPQANTRKKCKIILALPVIFVIRLGPCHSLCVQLTTKDNTVLMEL